MNEIDTMLCRVTNDLLYKGIPVITLPMVDALHKRRKNTASDAFSRRAADFTEGEDYFVVPFAEWNNVLKVENARNQKRGGHRGNMIFLTGSGYVLMTRPWQDDLSWAVWDVVVDAVCGVTTDRQAIRRSRRLSA